ncbi:MAG TPA: hypothetical protein VLV83_18940, partial [Acidobacteriota bacterium]|nr:hypothetical protein [Acidobacteriota bacterium]
MLSLGTESSFSQRFLQEAAAAVRHRTWSEEAFLRLVRQGRSPRAAWRERCLAAFLLEMQIAGVPHDSPSAAEFLFDLLETQSACRPEDTVRDLRLQGYSVGDPLQWLLQLKERLARHSRLHQALGKDPEDSAAWARLGGLLENEWRLLLARYLIPPSQVIGRVRRLTRTSCGLADPDVGEHPFFASESDHALGELPAYEGAVAQGLLESGEIWWVGQDTPSHLGSLVEYPLGSIVLIVRPPGSDWELELKRAGRRGPNPLRVFFRRGGRQIPKAHRLDCGSPSRHLRFEAGASTTFSRLFRLSQGRPAPLGRPLSLRSVHSVPGPQGQDVLLLAYLSDPACYGEEFPQLQSQLEDVLQAYQEEDDWEPPPLGGDIGRATLFLTQAAPGQMLLAGTSSFRLDRLALYCG